MKKLIYLLLFSFVAIFAFQSCKKPQGFDYRDIRNIKIDKIGFDQSALTMDLVYFNPNNFGVTLKKVDCDIKLNNNYFGHFALDTSIYIDKKSEFVLPAKINVSMSNIYKNIFTVLFNSDVDVYVKGTASINKIINLTIPFDYKGKHKFR